MINYKAITDYRKVDFENDFSINRYIKSVSEIVKNGIIAENGFESECIAHYVDWARDAETVNVNDIAEIIKGMDSSQVNAIITENGYFGIVAYYGYVSEVIYFTPIY